MKVKLSLAVAQRLLAYAAATRLEFSGFGFCDREPNGDIFVYDFVLLNVGSEVYTQINGDKILPLMEREDRAKMKVWIHRHPVLGWSTRDTQTILKEPLGTTPELAGWSVSIVLTPVGWIARIDNYLKNITKDLEIEPSVAEFYQEIHALYRAPFRPQEAGAGASGNGSGILEAGVQGTLEDENDPDWEELCDEADELDELYEGEENEVYEEEFSLDTAPAAELSFDTVQLALAQLAAEAGGSGIDPASTSFADICEDYRVDWYAIFNKARRQKR